MKSLGFFEIQSVTSAIEALDTMCKSADVELLTWERKLGGRLVTIVIQGNVSSVEAAISAAVESAQRPCVHAVIANPHKEIMDILELSKNKFK